MSDFLLPIPRFFVLLSHVNPLPIVTCPLISAPALAAAEQRTNKECASGSYLSFTGYQFGRSPSAGTELRTLRWQGTGKGRVAGN